MKNAPAITAIGVAMVLLLYVLSIGPVAAWHERAGRMPPHPAVTGFYLPLLWCCEEAPPVRMVMERYIELWLKSPGRTHP